MFGTYRYILALLVIFSHYHPIYCGRLNWTGMYAVFGFYVLSGYLMTRVLHQTYGFSGRGITHFLWNRALRIYPAYWVAAIVSLLVVEAIPQTVAIYSRVIGAPIAPTDVIRNVFIFGLDAWRIPRLVTPAWSLNVELCFYVLMATLLSRSRRSVAIWVVASALYTVYLVHTNVDLRSATVRSPRLHCRSASARQPTSPVGECTRQGALPSRRSSRSSPPISVPYGSSRTSCCTGSISRWL